MKRLSLFLVIITFMVTNLNPVIFMNDIKDGFPDGENNEIENKMVIGSINFLQSKTTIYSFFVEYEKSTLVCEDAKGIVGVGM